MESISIMIDGQPYSYTGFLMVSYVDIVNKLESGYSVRFPVMDIPFSLSSSFLSKHFNNINVMYITPASIVINF